MRFFSIAALCLFGNPTTSFAQRNLAHSEPYAIQGVRLAIDKDAPKHTILLQDGRIHSILPAGGNFGAQYRVLDADGLLALPGFIDAYSHVGIKMPEPNIDQDVPLNTGEDVRIEMRQANRKGIVPNFNAGEHWVFGKKESNGRLELGFAGLLSAPHGEILSGTSALSLMNGAPKRGSVLRGAVFAHAAFRASGDGYPSTLMGYHAQLRQFLMDAQRRRELIQRQAKGLSTPRFPFDADLDEASSLLNQGALLVCEAETARDIRRWFALADEFGLRIAISGGREAWKVAAELAERKIPVVLTLNWNEEIENPNKETHNHSNHDYIEPAFHEGDLDHVHQDDSEEDESADEGPEDPDAEEEAGKKGDKGDAKKDKAKEDPWTYSEPKALKVERRTQWEQQRDNALRLKEAGVELYFGSGSKSAKRLTKRLKVVAESGFDKAELVQILSERTAVWTLSTANLGALGEGRAATFCLWTEDPFAKKSRVQYAFMEGLLTEFEDKSKDKEKGDDTDSVDPTGHWVVQLGEEAESETIEFDLTLESPGTVTGTWQGDDTDGPQAITGTIEGKTLTLQTTTQMESMEIDVEVTAEIEGDSLSGTAKSTNPVVPFEIEITGQRTPEKSKPEGGR